MQLIRIISSVPVKLPKGLKLRRKAFGQAVVVVFSVLLAMNAHGIILSTLPSGVQVDAGSGEVFTLSYPVLLDDQGKEIHKIIDQQAGDKTATVQYEGGGLINVDVSTSGTIHYIFLKMPDDVKNWKVSGLIDFSYSKGGKWQIGSNSTVLFPSEKPDKPWLFQGVSKTMALTDPEGANFSLELPDNTYQELTDNRAWNWSVFNWFFLTPYKASEQNYVVRVHSDNPAASDDKTADDSVSRGGPPPGDWKMTFDEEFNGDNLDTSKWVTGMHFKDVVNNEMQGYVPENVTVANGVCTIKVEKRECKNTDAYGNTGPSQHYASSVITTMGKWTQTFGYWEASIRMPRGAGLWPAFWLLTDHGSQVENVDDRFGYADKGQGRGAEIDIMEFMSWWKSADGLFQSHSGIVWDYGPETPADPAPHNHISFALSNNGDGPAELFYPNADTQFHVYGLYWAADQLIFYLDRKPVYRVSDSKHIPNAPAYMLLNCALATNSWGKGAMHRDPSPQEVDAGLPDQMTIDYVKVYSGTLK